jgi:hypothetical protein
MARTFDALDVALVEARIAGDELSALVSFAGGVGVAGAQFAAVTAKNIA